MTARGVPDRCVLGFRAMEDPATALQAVENALRLVIRDVIGDGWTTSIADMTKLEDKRTEDKVRRDGAIVSDDLLAYTEFYQLEKIIKDNWQQFSAVFSDKKRTEVALGILEDVRNAIAHSRELLQFERELVSGYSGQLRNQVTIYRTRTSPATAHYPVIESVTDGLGQVGKISGDGWRRGPDYPPRLEVGETITFTCRGSDERGRELEWFLQEHSRGPFALGTSVILRWEVSTEHVGEDKTVWIRMRAVDSQFRRFHRSFEPEYDDERFFIYAVNPPRH
jgi:Swt1-like HEPN